MVPRMKCETCASGLLTSIDRKIRMFITWKVIKSEGKGNLISFKSLRGITITQSSRPNKHEKLEVCHCTCCQELELKEFEFHSSQTVPQMKCDTCVSGLLKSIDRKN